MSLRDALERTGGVITTGGLGPTADDRSKAAVASVFGRALQIDEEHVAWMKERWRTRFGREHAKGSKAPDLKEFFHVGQELPAGHKLRAEYPDNIWPTDAPGFKDTFNTLLKQLEVCALQLLEACALYIGEPQDRFASIAKDGNTILRVIHYPPVADDANPASIRAAAHEDINLIGTPAELVDKANAFREAGVTHLLGLYFAANTVSELLDQMQVFAEEVMPKIG